MNQIKFTLNPTEVINPSFEISDNFHDDIMSFVKKATDLEIDFLKAEKTTYQDGEHTMICYTFYDMPKDKADELERLSKAMAIFFSELINHSKN